MGACGLGGGGRLSVMLVGNVIGIVGVNGYISTAGECAVGFGDKRQRYVADEGEKFTACIVDRMRV